MAADGSAPGKLLALFCANVIHIAPWRVAEGLVAGAARHLREDGRLYLYGPFKRDGRHTAVSNAVFDTSLRSQNAEWGVRDIGDVVTLAEAAGLELAETFEMPANNLILMFARSSASASAPSFVGETPIRSANPATFVGNVRVAIQPRDLFPAAAVEGLGKGPLGGLVAVARTGNDRDRVNPGCVIRLARRSIRKTAPARSIRSARPPTPLSDVIGRISRPPSVRLSSHRAAGRVQPALT